MLETIYGSILYVSSAPLFWGSMGFTTALGMFVGAMLYDGNLAQASKGAFAVLTFSTMIVCTTLVRIVSVLGENPPVERSIMALGGIVTTVLITAFWLLGLILGVSILYMHNQFANTRK